LIYGTVLVGFAYRLKAKGPRSRNSAGAFL
jgi:hypothetical protein